MNEVVRRSLRSPHPLPAKTNGAEPEEKEEGDRSLTSFLPSHFPRLLTRRSHASILRSVPFASRRQRLGSEERALTVYSHSLPSLPRVFSVLTLSFPRP